MASFETENGVSRLPFAKPVPPVPTARLERDNAELPAEFLTRQLSSRWLVEPRFLRTFSEDAAVGQPGSHPLGSWTFKLRADTATDFKSLPADAVDELFLVANYTVA